MLDTWRTPGRRSGPSSGGHVADSWSYIYSPKSATCPRSDGPNLCLILCHVSTIGRPKSMACTETRVGNRTAQFADRTTKMVRNLVPRGTNPTARILRPDERHVTLNPTVQQEILLFFQTLQRFYYSKGKTTSSHCEQSHSCSVHENDFVLGI